MVDLVLQLRVLIGNNGARNDRTGHTASASQSHLGRNEDVRNVLILTQQRDVQDNLKGLGIGSHDDERGFSTVQSLGS